MQNVYVLYGTVREPRTAGFCPIFLLCLGELVEVSLLFGYVNLRLAIVGGDQHVRLMLESRR